MLVLRQFNGSRLYSLSSSACGSSISFEQAQVVACQDALTTHVEEELMEPGSAPERGIRSDAIRNHAAFIWSVADLLRGDYRNSEYGKVILPLTVIRRRDCVTVSGTV